MIGRASLVGPYLLGKFIRCSLFFTALGLQFENRLVNTRIECNYNIKLLIGKTITNIVISLDPALEGVVMTVTVTMTMVLTVVILPDVKCMILTKKVRDDLE